MQFYVEHAKKNMTTQFIIYNLTVLVIIAHFLDSAKEREWTDFLYRGSYTG